MQKRPVYAVPCAFYDDEDFGDIEEFFTTFHTEDEKEALALASCIVGLENAERFLVIISEDGEIFQL